MKEIKKPCNRAGHINKNFIAAFIFLLVVFAGLAGCSRNIHTCGKLEVYVPAEFGIKEAEIRERLRSLPVSGDGCTLRVAVYGYSGGAEVVAFNGADDFSTTTAKPWIKGLVEVIDGNTILRVDFIELSGKDREDMLDRFTRQVLELAGAR